MDTLTVSDRSLPQSVIHGCVSESAPQCTQAKRLHGDRPHDGVTGAMDVEALVTGGDHSAVSVRSSERSARSEKRKHRSRSGKEGGGGEGHSSILIRHDSAGSSGSGCAVRDSKMKKLAASVLAVYTQDVTLIKGSSKLKEGEKITPRLNYSAKLTEIMGLVCGILGSEDPSSNSSNDMAVIDVLGQSILDNLHDVPIQEYCNSVLFDIVYKDSSLGSAIIKSRALQGVVRGMAASPGVATLQEKACRNIWLLAVEEPNRGAIIAAGACACIVDALVRHSDKEGVVQAALGAAKPLSVNHSGRNELKSRDAGQATVNAMVKHPKMAKIQGEACSVLSNLAVDMVHKKVSVASLEEIDVVLIAMESHPNEPFVQRQGCFGLKNLTLHPDNLDLLLKSDIDCREILEKAIARFPDQCSKHGQMSLQRLNKHAEKQKVSCPAPKQVKERRICKNKSRKSKTPVPAASSAPKPNNSASPVPSAPSVVPNSPSQFGDHGASLLRPSSTASEPTATQMPSLPGHEVTRPASASSDPGPNAAALCPGPNFSFGDVTNPQENPFLRESESSARRIRAQALGLPPLCEDMALSSAVAGRHSLPVANATSVLIAPHGPTPQVTPPPSFDQSRISNFQHVQDDAQKWLVDAMQAGRRGDFSKAKGSFEVALKLKFGQYGLGESNAVLYHLLKCLGYVCAGSGDLEGALERYCESFDMQQRIHGKGGADLGMAATLSSIGSLRLKLGNKEHAEECLMDAVEMRRQIYGKDALHVDMAKDLEALGDIKCMMGKDSGAEKLYKYAAACYRNSGSSNQGGCNEGLSSVISKLGTLLGRRGDLQASQRLLEMALEFRKSASGPEFLSEDLVDVLNKLAYIYASSGLNVKAIQGYEDSLEMQRNLAETDKSRLTLSNTLLSLGVLYMREGILDVAADYLLESLDLKRALQGDDGAGVDLLHVLINLGEVCLLEDETESAVAFYEEALQDAKLLVYYEEALLQAGLGGDSKTVLCDVYLILADILHKLGYLYTSIGNYDNAYDFYDKSLMIKSRIEAVQSPDEDAIEALEGLGFLSAIRGECSVAIDKYEAALKMKQAMHGIDFMGEEVAKTLNTLGVLYLKQGSLSAAQKHLSDAVAMRQHVFGSGSHVAVCLRNLGDVYQARKRPEDAEELYEQAYDIMEECADDQMQHFIELANLKSRLGHVACGRGDVVSAQDHYSLALDIKREVYGDQKNLDLAETINNLAYVHALGGRYTEAIELYEESLSIQQSMHHADTEFAGMEKTLRSLDVLHNMHNGLSFDECLGEEMLDYCY